MSFSLVSDRNKANHGLLLALRDCYRAQAEKPHTGQGLAGAEGSE